MFNEGEIWVILGKGFWSGLAALGFGILFNSPGRVLAFIFGGGFLAGILKSLLMLPMLGLGIVGATFVAASVIGMLSLPISHLSHAPPVIFAIPSVIPLVPGVFAYRTMIGLMRFTFPEGDIPPEHLVSTVQNGAITFFVLMGIAIGVTLPGIIFRKDTLRYVRLLGKI